MRPAMLFPDVENWAVGNPAGYLRTALAARAESYATGAHVSNKDDPAKVRRVVFRSDGGPRANEVMQTVRFGCRVFAATEEDATDLALLVAALLEAGRGNGPVNRVTTNSPIPVDDPKGPMRYVTGEITVRGTAL